MAAGQFKNRREKLIFLHGLMQGTRSVYELMPTEFLVVTQDDETQTFKSDNRIFTMDELSQFKKANPQTTIIKIIWD